MISYLKGRLFHATLYEPVLKTGFSELPVELITSAISILLSQVPCTTHLTLPLLSITQPFTWIQENN
jgi:hypothetical protein